MMIIVCMAAKMLQTDRAAPIHLAPRAFRFTSIVASIHAKYPSVKNATVTFTPKRSIKILAIVASAD